MNQNFQKVKHYLLELDFDIQYEGSYSIFCENDPKLLAISMSSQFCGFGLSGLSPQKDHIFVVEKEHQGIKKLVLIIAAPLLIVEQFLFTIDRDSIGTFRELFMKNREVIHGAFTLDATGTKVLFRNTHECENLDLNELEATLNSLALLLSEYADKIIDFSKEKQIAIASA